MKLLHAAIKTGLVASAHDVSDGGVLVALAEMLIGGSSQEHPIGFEGVTDLDHTLAFGEPPSRVLVETNDPEALAAAMGAHTCITLGTLTDSGNLEWGGVETPVEALAAAWRATLDW